MLEFSDAPYQFFPPRPSAPVIWAGRQVNRFLALPGKNHRISELKFEGEFDSLRERQQKGDRLVFVINHPSHSDPQVVTELHRQLGIPSCYLAAYDVFLRSSGHAWAMQRLGNFSIDRDGSDRKAMTTAIGVIKEGHFALNIFPEGNVYLTNDRVTPFLDGTAFIAVKAQQALEGENVHVVPVSLKFTHLTAPRAGVTARLQQLAEDSGHSFDSSEPLPAVMGLGAHLISDYLFSHGYGDRIGVTEDSFFEDLVRFANELISDCESGLGLESSAERSRIDRIRAIRSTIHQARTAESPDTDAASLVPLAEKAILALRVHGYITPYLNDHPTIDRYDETVERIAEDYYSRAMPRTGPRRAIARIHPPLSVREYLEQSDGKLRGAVSNLTIDTEATVQRGIDEINATNDAPGAMLVRDAP